ncbi:DUF551 domain-containing protein [Enterobacter sichuanensis]|uniref:DUF551 domain-containing protein n=1 Tax=Enterobacter sichuanensis TaxID=2071710 RepID=UPI003754F417
MSTITKEFTKEQLIEFATAILDVEKAMEANDLSGREARASAAIAEIALASLEAEPVAWLLSGGGAKNNVSFDSGNAYADPLREVTPLYTAPPAPVSVPDEDLLHMAASAIEDLLSNKDRSGAGVWADVPAKLRRAAMLQGADGTLTNEGTIPVTQFKPVADLYGLTSPTGGETSFTFDAVEARDFIDGGWLCQEYVELGRFQEAMLQNGNSPAQSDCCPEQNYIAPAQDGDSPVIPDGWIPVSERMPGSQEWVIVFAKWDNQQVLCWDDVANRWTDFEDQSYYADMFTHWMPLPAAPQQEA